MILRPTSIADAEQMFNNWASDPEVTKYMTFEPHASIEVSKGILAEWDKKSEEKNYYHWGIVLKENGRLIGTGGTHGVNEMNQSAVIGYCISRAYWGRGLMTEAVSAMLEYLFNTVGVNRVFAGHHPENIASGRVMQKCGMIFEGIRRQTLYRPRYGFSDEAYYAILKNDYISK